MKRSQWAGGCTPLSDVSGSFFSSLCLSCIHSHWVVEASVSVLAFKFSLPVSGQWGALRWSVPRLCSHPLGSFPSMPVGFPTLFKVALSMGQVSRYSQTQLPGSCGTTLRCNLFSRLSEGIRLQRPSVCDGLRLSLLLAHPLPHPILPSTLPSWPCEHYFHNQHISCTWVFTMGSSEYSAGHRSLHGESISHT